MTRMLMLMLGALLVSTPALAQSRGQPTVRQVKSSPSPNQITPAAGRVSIQVQVVHANNSGQVDPQLKGVVDNLSFLRYSGFRLLDTHNANLGNGQEANFGLVGGRKLEVQLVSRDARQAKVRVRMTSAKGVLMDTTVSIHRNRAFMIAGPSHDGGKLVLPLTVRY